MSDIMCQSEAIAVRQDLNAGNLAAAGHDLTSLQASIYNLQNPDDISAYQTQHDLLAQDLANMSPQDQANAQANFAAENSFLTNNASALNNDLAYNASQGDLTSTAAGYDANAASGAFSNYNTSGWNTGGVVNAINKQGLNVGGTQLPSGQDVASGLFSFGKTAMIVGAVLVGFFIYVRFAR